MKTSLKLIYTAGAAISLAFAGAVIAHPASGTNCPADKGAESCQGGSHANHANHANHASHGGMQMHGGHGQGKQHGGMAMHGGMGGGMGGARHQQMHGNPSPTPQGADTQKN